MGTTNSNNKEEEEEKSYWKELKNNYEKEYEEIAINNQFINNCTIQKFFNLFLSDNAKYSIQYFQTNIIKDTDLQVTPWTIDNDTNTNTNLIIDKYSRTIKFIHHFSSSSTTTAIIGPSSTRGIKYQSYRIAKSKKNNIIVVNTITKL